MKIDSVKSRWVINQLPGSKMQTLQLRTSDPAFASLMVEFQSKRQKQLKKVMNRTSLMKFEPLN
jgi:hypothetical protein